MKKFRNYNNNFVGTNIKIIICKNHVEYINNLDRKNKIFEIYLSSKLGGHSRVNRTYNRIEDKFFLGKFGKQQTKKNLNVRRMPKEQTEA